VGCEDRRHKPFAAIQLPFGFRPRQTPNFPLSWRFRRNSQTQSKVQLFPNVGGCRHGIIELRCEGIPDWSFILDNVYNRLWRISGISRPTRMPIFISRKRKYIASRKIPSISGGHIRVGPFRRKAKSVEPKPSRAGRRNQELSKKVSKYPENRILDQKLSDWWKLKGEKATARELETWQRSQSMRRMQ